MTGDELEALERDAARYRWLAGAWTQAELAEDHKAERQPAHRPQVEVVNHMSQWYLCKEEVDHLVDGAMQAHGAAR